MVVWNCNGYTEVVYYAESKVVSHMQPEVDPGKAAYPLPPVCHYGRGTTLKFSQVF